jgi:hypothetical protein
MRPSHVATALAAFIAGLTAAAALRRLADRHMPATTAAPFAALPSVVSVRDRDAVVLPFARPAVAEPRLEQPAAPGRCGDSGGLTKAGAPCGARGTTGGRCYHHPMAA